MKKGSLIVLVVVVILVGVKVWLSGSSEPSISPEQQIRQQFETARHAVEQGEWKTIMGMIADDFKGISNGGAFNAEQIRTLIYQRMGKADHARVQYEIGNIELTGDTAHLRAQVRVTYFADGEQHEYDSGLVEMYWRRETARRWLLFPVQVWRVYRAEGFNIE